MRCKQAEKRVEQIDHTNNNPVRAGVPVRIADEIDSKAKAITPGKRGHL